MNALNDMNQKRVEWDCGTTGIGVLVSDSLMFQRGDPAPGDPHLSNFYGLALPFLKRGMPVTSVQLENVEVENYLDGFKLLLLSYHGMKPLSPDVHSALAKWVKKGGTLLVCDDDADPYNKVRDWWNTGKNNYTNPRQHLFEKLGVSLQPGTNTASIEKAGKGAVLWLSADPAKLAANRAGAEQLVNEAIKAKASATLKWRETNYLLLRRGPYTIAAGLDESVAGEPKTLSGRFVNLFDPELRVQNSFAITPGSRYFLLDLNATPRRDATVLASACKALVLKKAENSFSLTVEGVANTSAILLISTHNENPKSVTLDGKPLTTFQYSPQDNLLWLRFENESHPRELKLGF